MKNDNGRLSEGTIKAIRLMIADNQSIDTIMETLRISRTTVYRWGFSNVPISEQVDATSKMSEWWFNKINSQNKLLYNSFHKLKKGDFARLIYRNIKYQNRFTERKIEGPIIHKDNYKIIIEVNPWTRECWTRNDFMCGSVRINK